MILSQLVDADELKALTPEELRDMILRLDDEVVYGATEELVPDPAPSQQAPSGEQAQP
ncbi:hypothetical protein [Actinophytocola algeriensis]|uniref:Uncharacterized protein n=1 Tax=Actinophytocola algeriensis TaxID=1768010 RepID=A0A7W7VDG6_9PSEU|nr:hypothetical protein [Actinophytocola algeriensis]MBB4906178.1 hypothetical protein [Actinophytocola algeriensis]MBE1472137.1 hypothetical protein [Actinophytocola algeriensis]